MWSLMSCIHDKRSVSGDLSVLRVAAARDSVRAILGRVEMDTGDVGGAQKSTGIAPSGRHYDDHAL